MCFKPEGENFVNRRSGEGSKIFFVINESQKLQLCTGEGYWENEEEKVSKSGAESETENV